MYLSETTEESWLSIEPVLSKTGGGQVINFNDYFYLRAVRPSTPFYLHVFNKPSDEFTDT